MTLAIIFFAAIVILFFGIVFGYLQYKRRSADTAAITEAATRELYKQPDAYADEVTARERIG